MWNVSGLIYEGSYNKVKRSKPGDLASADEKAGCRHLNTYGQYTAMV